MNPGTGPQLLSSSTVAGEGTNGESSPFKPKVQVQNNKLAYVQDPLAPGSNDHVMLSSLSGPLAGGLGTIDVTPVAPQPQLVGISDESLTITTNKVLFVGSTTSATPTEGQLFEAPADGSASATLVPLPPMGTGTAATTVDAVVRYSEDRSYVVFQAGPSPTEQDIFVLLDPISSPLGILGGSTVINLTQFPSPTEIVSFGLSSNGTGNTVATSPGTSGSQRVAFVVNESGDDELFFADLSNPGVSTQLTGGNFFQAAVGTIVELHWTSDDTLMFFAGDTANTTHLYAYSVSADTVANLTDTSTPPPTPPYPAGGTIDPGSNFFNSTGTWYFIFREGEVSGNQVQNLIAVNTAQSLANLAVLNVTGGEFGGASQPNSSGVTPSESNMQFASNTDVVAFVGQSGGGNEDNVFGFNCATPLSPKILTNNSGMSGSTIDNLAMSADGTLVAFGDNVTGTELIYVASTQLDNSATVVFEPAIQLAGLGKLTDGTIQWVSNHELMLAYGSNGETNPTNATLIYVEVAVRFNVTMDPEEKSYWNY